MIIDVNTKAQQSENHTDQLASQHKPTLAYRGNWRVKKAVQMLEQIVALKERMLAEDHPSQLVTQRAIAITRKSQVKSTLLSASIIYSDGRKSSPSQNR
jgi:hypothetical protein